MYKTVGAIGHRKLKENFVVRVSCGKMGRFSSRFTALYISMFQWIAIGRGIMDCYWKGHHQQQQQQQQQLMKHLGMLRFFKGLGTCIWVMWILPLIELDVEYLMMMMMMMTMTMTMMMMMMMMTIVFITDITYACKHCVHSVFTDVCQPILFPKLKVSSLGMSRYRD